MNNVIQAEIPQRARDEPALVKGTETGEREEGRKEGKMP